MAPHTTTLAWKIPWTEEPGGLQSTGSLKSQTRLSDFTFTFHFHALEKEMAPHSSVLACRVPGIGGAWWAAVYGVAQSRTRLKRLSSSSSRRRGNLLRKGNLCFGSTYTDSMDASLSELQELVMDREAWRAVMGLQRVRHD